MQLTFLSEEHRVRTIPSRVSEREWMASVVASRSPMLQLLAVTAPDGWRGRTSPASFQATEDATLQAFWDCSAGNELKSPATAGEMREWSRATIAHTASHGECLTLSMSEWTALDEQCLSDAGASSLSDILETGDVPQRYYLSSKACAGILRRADLRGKTLPPQLARALQAVADLEPTSTVTADCSE